MKFNTFKNLRKKFLQENNHKDHAAIDGSNHVLISAPHGVSQVRLGKNKVAEIGSLSLALILAKKCDTNLIAKTKNSFDDANFDQICAYKLKLDKIVSSKQITHIIDFHGLAPSRPMDINLGINFGHNTETDPALLNKLISALESHNFMVSIDQPFSGGSNTIAGSSKMKHTAVWTIQIEVNSALTNKAENIERLNILIDVLSNWIKQI